jgi:RimJ/RimL family protein N-acetyltransferase
MAENAASRRLLEKIGLELEGTRPGYRLKEGRHDELLYGARAADLDRKPIDALARRAALLT